MHRSYQPSKPSANKLLAKRWDDSTFTSHRDRVRVARPMVDNGAPSAHMHLNLKLKKMQLEEERQAVIDRDNRLLLEKMSTIMHTRGRIEHRNNYEHKSLNKIKRQREMMSVTRENQKMMVRLGQRKANYSREDLARDWDRSKRYKDSIRRYGTGWYQEMERSGQVAPRFGASGLSRSAPTGGLKNTTVLPPIGSAGKARTLGAEQSDDASSNDASEEEEVEVDDSPPVAQATASSSKPISSQSSLTASHSAVNQAEENTPEESKEKNASAEPTAAQDENAADSTSDASSASKTDVKKSDSVEEDKSADAERSAGKEDGAEKTPSESENASSEPAAKDNGGNGEESTSKLDEVGSTTEPGQDTSKEEEKPAVESDPQADEKTVDQD